MVGRKALLIVGIFLAVVILIAVIYAIVQAFIPETNDRVSQTTQSATQESAEQAEISGYENTPSLLGREQTIIDESIYHQLEHVGLIEDGDRVNGTIKLEQGSNASAIQTYLVSTQQRNFRITFDRNQTNEYRIQIECQGEDGSFGGYYCAQH